MDAETQLRACKAARKLYARYRVASSTGRALQSYQRSEEFRVAFHSEWALLDDRTDAQYKAARDA